MREPFLLVPERRQIFAVTVGLSPSGIIHISYRNDGKLTTEVESPYHADYPLGPMLWLMADGDTLSLPLVRPT